MRGQARTPSRTRAVRGTIPAALSIDLALASYAAIGVACVRASASGALHAHVVRVPLSGRPDVGALAAWINETALRLDAGCLGIDGPLGWRGPETDSVHCRLSERAVRAPGKTGLPPDGVKPRTYQAFTQLSIALFEQLTRAGWKLPSGPQSIVDERMITETFPTAAWRSLGLVPLPGKSRSRPADVTKGASRLTAACGIHIDGLETHDDLQAVVGGIAPAWWMAGLTDRIEFAGAPPFRFEGSWREGHIILPTSHRGTPSPQKSRLG